MAYVDRGHGPLVVFLHGNPTSSFLWRNVIAPLEPYARCIAPDLIGMGDSEKLPDSSYGFFEHRHFLDGFLDAIEGDLVLVLHDWGSALGFDWARRHPDRVRGIAYMEAIAGPMTWEGRAPEARAMFERLRSPEGESLVLEQNAFVEKVLPSGILRTLTDAEMAEYRRPFFDPASRRPTLTFPRQLPILGEPPDIDAEVRKYAAWLAASPIPKLFIDVEPGRLLVGPLRDACRKWPNQTEVTVRGLHYVQEDSPAEIAEAIRAWMP